MDKNAELKSKCLAAWMLRSAGRTYENYQNDPEIVEGGDPLSTILYRKIQWAGLDIKIPDECFLLISICTQSLGAAQIMLREILEKIPDLKAGYLITAEDFVRVYTMEFPDTENPKWDKHFHDLWDAQKKERQFPGDSDNQCDTKEYWTSLIK